MTVSAALVIRMVMVSVLSLGLASCWESVPFRDPASVISLVDGKIYFVTTDYVERLNTNNYPQVKSPELVSVSHRLFVVDGTDAPPAEFAGHVDTHSVPPGDKTPYLFVEGGAASVWDHSLLLAHLLETAAVSCRGGEWFYEPVRSAPMFYVCADDTVHRFDGPSAANCVFDLGPVAALPRFDPSESPVRRIISHRGESATLIEASNRFFTVDSCAGGVPAEFDPFAGLPVEYQPVQQARGHVRTLAFTELADFSEDARLFTTGSVRGASEAILVLRAGMPMQRFSIPEPLRGDVTHLAGPWLDQKGGRVVWFLSRADGTNGGRFFVLNTNNGRVLDLSVSGEH